MFGLTFSYTRRAVQFQLGGWAKILQIKSPYGPNVNAIGNVAEAGVTATAKLSDAQIKALQLAFDGWDVFRMNSASTSLRVYTRHASGSNRFFVDTLSTRAWNVFAGARQTCMNTAYSSCGFCSTTFDSVRQGSTRQPK